MTVIYATRSSGEDQVYKLVLFSVTCNLPLTYYVLASTSVVHYTITTPACLTNKPMFTFITVNFDS